MRDQPYHIKNHEGGHVLFTLGSWEIHADIEDSEWAEVFHNCKKWDLVDDRVEYAYQIPGDTACPGCGAIQPDEIQALEQMHNMDRPARQYGRSVMWQIKRDYEKTYREMLDERNMDIQRDGE